MSSNLSEHDFALRTALRRAAQGLGIRVAGASPRVMRPAAPLSEHSQARPSGPHRQAAQSRGRTVVRLSLLRTARGLRWHLPDDPQAPYRKLAHSRGARSGAGPHTALETVAEYDVDLLRPNEIRAFLAGLDSRLTPHRGLRRLRHGRLTRVDRPRDRGRTLVFVHGTFVGSEWLLDNVRGGSQGRAFLARLERHYDEVLCFDHPTLSLSPFLNAFELQTHFAASKAAVDVIAHSRGGLVTRWWFEALRQAPGRNRAVLVGSPLGGTSLASPGALRAGLDLLTNYAVALQAAAGAVSAAPFFLAALALLRVVVSITSVGAHTPLLDAVLALVPGLAAQSRTADNTEVELLRRLPTTRAAYAVVQSNFEPTAAGWEFWKAFRAIALADRAADHLFPGPNDLIVDTASMSEVGARPLPRGRVLDFGTSAVVHHAAYFAQPQTLDFITAAFGVP